ncbi:hypothetical protein N8I77_006097 [Diaporthe amygdali]|uniref:RNA polymerase I-specific transcription initiation factor RRN6-like protein n=1 Tax=Phomopsis amygdali TaxID=1214568 RepID=A0AAD9SH94_PHOAM|nr:hypothetical protein N8I77_006097 [Diaporthe amygdali]
MAESSLRSDGDGHHYDAQNRKSNTIEIHRVNDFLLGHVGQVSYHSVRDEDADVGGLGFSRVTEKPPSFQQILPSEDWFPPMRSTSNAAHGGSFKDTKSSKYWLLKTHPEAFLGNVDLQGAIAEQLRASRYNDGGMESQMGPVLAVGEISDLRNPSRATSRPAVAVAAGETGHVLRVSMIGLEKCMWANSSFPIGAVQTQFHGTWNSDGAPISKILFATKPRQQDPIRWLIAQRSTSTTVFRPEIRAKPSAKRTQTATLDNAALQHIALNPVVTLNADATGGDAHSDFSINVGSEAEAPQIAIVDRSGNWSVWFIESQHDHHGRSLIHKAALKNRGTCGFSPTTWPSNRPLPFENHHRISWVCKTRRSHDWERDSSPSETSDPASRSLQADYLTGRMDYDPKCDGLLISNNTCASVLDIDGVKVYSYLDFSKRKGADALLDAQSIEGCPTHVLALTTEKLYVLDISSVGDSEASKPNILVSCPHFRGQTNETLKMSVARLQSSDDWLVLLHSGQNHRVQFFYMTISPQDGSASFYHQVVQYPGLNTRLDGLAGIASLHAVPLRFVASNSRYRSQGDAADAYMDGQKPQLFQLFELAGDLSLTSSVVAIAPETAQSLGWLRKSNQAAWNDAQRRTSLRKKVLRDVEDAFVVPDAVEDDRRLRRQLPTKGFPSRNTVQLRSYLIKLMKEINDGFFGECSLGSAGNTSDGPFDLIQDVWRKREANEHIALKPLLGFKDSWHSLDLARVGAVWNTNLERLQKLSDVQLFQRGTFGPKLDVTDFFERFAINWSSRLAAESLTATQWRYMQLALERMAAEVYLSEKSLSMIPQSTLDLVSKAIPRRENSQSTTDDLYEELRFSRSGSAITMPTPSATPASSRTTSRATSQAPESLETEDEDDTGQEDPAVTRLRMYLPSIRFTPPPKQGQSRVLSFWPEQRGSNPQQYRYSPTGKGSDEVSQRAQRRREKEEDRRRRRAEKRANLGIKLEGFSDSFSQPYVPDEIRSSPPPQLFAKSQGQHQSFGFGSQSQAPSQSQGFGPSQTMSQPLRGEFGTRPSMLKKKIKGKKKGFK